jgi:4-carboxymuconolactone decarboxylase
MTQQFEWFVHVPLALDEAVKAETIAGLAGRRRPEAMATDEEIAYDFCNELVQSRGVAETTYRRAVEQFGEQGVIDMLGLLGYFTTVSMVMNVARTPPPEDDRVTPLALLPA